MLKDLTVLTPPLVVCAAFLIGVGFFLRHEMRRGRRRRESDRSADFADGDGISARPTQQGPADAVDEDAQDRIEDG